MSIKGGLGNQLQQYALYRKFISMGVDAKVDLSWFDDLNQVNMAAKRRVELDYFPGVNYQSCTRKERKRLVGGDGVLGKIRRKLFGLCGAPLVKIYSESTMYDEKLLTLKDCYLDGYFANEFYYADIINELKKELTFPVNGSKNKDKILEYANQMNAEESVSIHLRRGDYLDKINQAMFGGICTDEYYESAVKYILENVDKPRFYIFSDDTEYALKFSMSLQSRGYVAEVIDINHGDESFYDIFLMSKCKHHITANSTFSFWGARLSDEDGIKIRPSKQKNSQEFCEEMHTWWKMWIFVSALGEVL